MATPTVPHVLLPSSTNTDSINFYRLCCVVLDDIPEVLRDVFKQNVQAKHKYNWTDTPKSGQWLLQQEKWNSKLSLQQRQLLENGNTNDWDSALLFHVLLYSNLHLLVNNPVPHVQIILDPSLDVVKVTSAHVNFNEILCPGSKVMLDLGNDVCWAEVTTVQRNQFNFRKPYPFPHDILQQTPTADVWVCQPEWCAVADLLYLRNHSFAHHHSNAGISTSELQRLLQNVESAYTALSRLPQVIADMRAAGKEHISSDAVVQKIYEYREQWTREQQQFKQLKQQELHGDVDDFAKIVTQSSEKEEVNAASQQEIHQNGKHSSACAVDGYKVEEGSVEIISSNIPSLQTQLTDVTEGMSTVVHTDSPKTGHNMSELKGDLDAVRTDNDATINYTAERGKQVSLEWDWTGIGLNMTESVASTPAWSQRQLSDEVQRTTELVQNLSFKEEETADHVLVLNKQVHGIEKEVEKLKENVELIHQDSISENPLRKLNPSHFESDIRYYAEKYHPGTREWLFGEVNKWHEHTATDTNRNIPNICLVTGNPGMGKSVIAAKLCTMGEEKRILAGCFFFQHNKTRRSTPKMLVQTLTYQFSSVFPEFQEMAADALTEMKVNSASAIDLFTVLILEPLHQLPQDLPKMYIVIDALDECEFDSRNELLKLILREFIKLPKWISVILTSRPDQKILQRLRRIKPVIELIPDDPRNVMDITIFLRSILQEKISKEEFEAGVELLVKKSEGMFLYFHYAVDTLVVEDSLTLSKLESLLPDGIDDYYDQNFQRLYVVLGEEKYQTLLQAIIAARADFPQGLVAPLLKISLLEATQIIETISVLLPAHNDHIYMFHKSVRDWLTDEELAGEYMVDPSSGHHHLALLCHTFFQDIKTDAPTKVKLTQNPTKRYTIENAVYHLCSASALKFSEQIVSTVEDLQYMYYRLTLAKGTSEELLADYSQAKAALRSDLQLYQRVQNCESFIKRYAQLLNNMPHLVLQCALNEPHMFSQRLRVQQYLSDPTRFFPSLRVYLEVTNKLQTSGSVLITYACRDNITNFITVEEEGLLICSDERGKLYFWNKQTAELVHEDATSHTFPNRIKNISISPDGKITFGSISKVLTLDGNTVPLIPLEKSDTNACVFSPDGKKLLAWNFQVDGFFKLMKEIVHTRFKPIFNVKLWDLASCTCSQLEVIHKIENRPLSACFSHNGSHIYCGHRNGRIVQWETTMGSPTAIMYTDGTVTRKGAEPLVLREGPPRDDPIYHVNHSPNGYFFTACCNQGILIWDAVALYLVHTLPLHPGAAIEHCPSGFLHSSFSDDNKHFVAGTSDGVLKTWRVDSLATKSDQYFVQEISTKPEGSTAPIACCMFDKSLNIMCAIESVVRIYSYEALLFSTKVGEQDSPTVHPGTATTSAFLPDGETALTCGGNALCLWHLPTKALLASSNCNAAGHLICLSSDGKLVLTFGKANRIQLWETADGLRLECTLMHQQQNQNIQPDFSSDDPEDMTSEEDICSCAVSIHAIVVGGTGNGFLYLWYGEDHSSVKVLEAHQPNLITWCEFSPDGQRFVSADMEGGIIMWQLIDGGGKMEVNMVPLEGHEDSIGLVFFSPGQARRIVSCSDDKTLNLYNGPSGDLLKKINGHNEGVERIAWSSDGSMIASGDGKGQVNIWDGFTGELKQHLPLFAGFIINVSFTYEDRYICTRDLHEGVIHIHDVTTGSQVSCLFFSAPICTVSSSPGPWIICGLKDASVKFIKLHSITAQNQQQTDVCIAHSGELQSMDDTILGIESLLEVRTALVSLDPKLWRSLGLCLEVEDPDLLEIASDYEGDVSQCLTEVIARWLQSLSSPSWKSLAVATWNLDNKLAYTVAQNHQEGRFSRQISLGFISEEDPLLQGIDHDDLGNNSSDVSLALLAGGQHLNLFHLGLVLGLSYGTLRSIWGNHRGDYRSCLIDIVADWLKWIDEVRTLAIGETCCSWKILIRALLHPLVRHRALAERIAKDHNK